MSINSHYVYIYLDPRKSGKFNYENICFFNEPIYVGIGCGRRFLTHLRAVQNNNLECRNLLKFNKIKSILNSGNSPIIFKLYDKISKTEAELIEIGLISSIGRIDLKTGPLTNLTKGGLGGPAKGIRDEHHRKVLKNLPSEYYSNKSKLQWVGKTKEEKELMMKKLRECSYAYWEVSNEKGEIFIIKGLFPFCNERGLPAKVSINAGKRNKFVVRGTGKGWKAKKIV